MKLLLILLALFVTPIFAQQEQIAQFAVWKPKPGLAADFAAGYQRHLKWHKENGDRWGWYGWYTASGPNTGQFVDATFGHTWNDFDNAVNPAGDRADNQLNVYPYADLVTVFKVARMTPRYKGAFKGLKSKILRMVTVEISDMRRGIVLAEALRNHYRATNPGIMFETFKVIDGGDADQVIILIGSDSFAEFGRADDLQEVISDIQARSKTSTVKSVRSEMLRYSAEMSLFPD